MIALTRSRQRAEEFAALVDDTRAPLRPVSNESAASASARELDRLVGVVAVMRREASADEAARPQPAFAADLRERLMAEAVEVLTPQQAALVLPPRTRGTRERRLVAAATAAVLLGGTAGIAAAAQGSLPGEALYPIKRGIEDARVGLATSPGAEGRQLLAHASDRLAEVQGLVAAGPRCRHVPDPRDPRRVQQRGPPRRRPDADVVRRRPRPADHRRAARLRGPRPGHPDGAGRHRAAGGAAGAGRGADRAQRDRRPRQPGLRQLLEPAAADRARVVPRDLGGRPGDARALRGPRGQQPPGHRAARRRQAGRRRDRRPVGRRDRRGDRRRRGSAPAAAPTSAPVPRRPTRAACCPASPAAVRPSSWTPRPSCRRSARPAAAPARAARRRRPRRRPR